MAANTRQVSPRIAETPFTLNLDSESEEKLNTNDVNSISTFKWLSDGIYNEAKSASTAIQDKTHPSIKHKWHPFMYVLIVLSFALIVTNVWVYIYIYIYI